MSTADGGDTRGYSLRLPLRLVAGDFGMDYPDLVDADNNVITECLDPRDAAYIVQAFNAFPALVAACEAACTGEYPCSYDHHGLCQAHALQPKGECYVELARAALAQAGVKE